MEKPLANDLTPQMQARLNKWKARTDPVKKESAWRQKAVLNYVARHKNQWDDFSDVEEQAQSDMNKKIFRTNP